MLVQLRVVQRQMRLEDKYELSYVMVSKETFVVFFMTLLAVMCLERNHCVGGLSSVSLRADCPAFDYTLMKFRAP
jgi:hypothetical protein